MAPLEPPAADTTIAVVLGASEYPQKPAWSNPVLGASARGVRDYLRSPTGLAMQPPQVLDLFDATGGPGDQLVQIEEFLKTTGEGARDLIVYYVGHGCFDHDDYCLGIRATQREREFLSTIESKKLARIIREGFARKRVYVILDSCFAASAASDWMGDEVELAVRKMSQPLPRQGTAFLAAASKFDVTRAPRGERYTVFTGAVLDALTIGVDRVQSRLSLYELYEEVRDRLQRRVSDEEARPELHVPSQREGDVSRLELFPNAAYYRVVEARVQAVTEVRRVHAETEARAQADTVARTETEDWDAQERRRWFLEEQAEADVLAARAEAAAAEPQWDRVDHLQEEATWQQSPPRRRRWTPLLVPQISELQPPPLNQVSSLPSVQTTGPAWSSTPSTPEAAPATSPDRSRRRVLVVGTSATALVVVLITLRSCTGESFPETSFDAAVPFDAAGDATPIPPRVLSRASPEKATVTTPIPPRVPSGASPEKAAVTGCSDEMVPVPAGTFLMGSRDGVGDADEHPQHDVTLSAFCIDKTEVTVAAYTRCVASGKCTVTNGPEKVGFDRLCNGTRGDRQYHPINCVDWNQATVYCAWAKKRLPSEAEWEYAALGGDGRTYPWGNEAPSAKRLNACGSECRAVGSSLGMDWAAMYEDSDGWSGTAVVGSFQSGASQFGALDMAGNVSEWTADWYGAYTAGASANPHGAKEGKVRVVRGGGWLNGDTSWVRGADRDWNEPGLRYTNLGFRCVRGD